VNKGVYTKGKGSLITFRMSRRRREMYSGHARLSAAPYPHYCTDPDVTWSNGRGAPLVCSIEPICNRCTGCVATVT